MTDIIKQIEDRYTSRANPRRGYHDSERIVTFSAGTEDEQLEKMTQIRKDLADGNMWCYGPEKVQPNVWRINYGYDSGD